MARTVSIIGAGRVGKTLGKRLRGLGWRIGAVVTRSKATSRAAVRAIGAGTPASRLTGDVLAAEVILLATPDDALAGVAQALARTVRKTAGNAWRGKVVLHASGALDRTVLAPLARLGASTGSLHPMQTFSGVVMPRLNGITFAIEGDPKARRAARSIAKSLGGVPVIIAGRDKPAYHATAVLVAGSGFPLIESGVRILERIGFTRRRALETLLPLTRQMLDNIERIGPRAAWTGPIARGDYAVVAKHVRALRRYPREFRQSYAALALLAGRVLSKNPAVALGRLKRALADR
ncbi:MAG: Rossmann-like and DUF2520 domain-containing protein [Candidatus Acidiferrales bacterium]|jgi:predicted short-subunit dehydrogenase-like oxidoreductase (DUF2520 family)